MRPALANSSAPVLQLSKARVGSLQPKRLKITTRRLAEGVKGLFYLQVLSASGGVPPYRWEATGLPGGLTLSRTGVISGYPRSARTRTVRLRVRDARHKTRQAQAEAADS